MRFGVCCSLDRASAVLAAGFDYVELPAGQVFYLDPAPISQLKALHAETTNLFLVDHYSLLAPDQRVWDYARAIIPRAAEAGVRVMVLGSGGARRASDAEVGAAAEEAFADTAKRLSDIAKESQVVLAPESLRREETNVGNELGSLARRLHARGVAFTADSFHLLHDWRRRSSSDLPPSDEFWEQEIPFLPVHVHLGSFERTWRVKGDADIAGFARRLRHFGYEGRMSLECSWKNEEDELSLALEEVKAVFAADEQP